jgi:sulfide:quinone oxidoreductase
MANILVLGGGFGGITVATEVIRALGPDHPVTLIDRSETFMMGLRKLWGLVGIAPMSEGQRSRSNLAEPGIRVVRTEITAIDPAARRVTTNDGVFEADYLVVALGAESRPDLVPGLKEHAHNVWDPAGVPAAAEALSRFEGGRLAVIIAGAPYTCPPAPYECTLLLHEYLEKRGIRDRTDLSVTTLQPILMPNAGKEGSDWLAGQLEARGIQYRTGRKPERVEAGRVIFEDGEMPFDLLIGIPPHRVPAVVRDSGLTGDGDWIAADPGTLATSYPRVFAIGDAVQIRLANGLPLPKAGLIAELEGRRVAAAIVADVRGEPEPAPFDGHGLCFIEMSSTEATVVDGDFYATPQPAVALGEVSRQHLEDKRTFESTRLADWFRR